MSTHQSAGQCPRCGDALPVGAVACGRCGWSAVQQGVPASATAAGVGPQRSALWPTVLVTVFFNIFGVIPAAIGSDRDRSNGFGGGRQWLAFFITWLAETLAGLLMALVLTGVGLSFLGHSGSGGSVASSVATDAAPASQSAGQQPVSQQSAGTTVTVPGGPATQQTGTQQATTQQSANRGATTSATSTSTVALGSVTATVTRTCGASGTGDCYLTERAQPQAGSGAMQRFSNGDTVQVVCQVHGETESSSIAGTSDVWSRTVDGGYVSNLFLDGAGLSTSSITTPCR